jgi:broad specificity phosphatase PhoE
LRVPWRAHQNSVPLRRLTETGLSDSGQRRCGIVLEDGSWVNGARHLYLVRHAEAYKNVEGRLGGRGSDLTAAGTAQAGRVGACLGRREVEEGHRVVVYAHATPQVRQTAAAIVGALGCSSEEDERLRGLCLGRLAGLTREEARAVDPAAVDRLDGWARGQLRVDHLDLPGGEDLARFRERVAGCLDRIRRSSEDACAVVVATTSTLIMLQNLLALGPAFSYGRYRPYSYENGAVCRWTLRGESATEEPLLVGSSQRGGGL